MGGVVPLLSEAVASIVSHSTSEQFRSTATEILQVRHYYMPCHTLSL